MIHVGDGRHIAMLEGGLRPPAPVKRSPMPNRPKCAPKYNNPAGNPVRDLAATPGWTAWRGRQNLDRTDSAPPETNGKPKGHSDGFRKAELEALRKSIVNTLMTDDEISGLLASIKDEDPIAAFAMREMIKLAAAPGALRDRASLLRTILEFTKSKPATKTDVNIAQQDAWAMMLTAEATTVEPTALPHDAK